MADLKFKPVPHDHEAFLKKASKRKAFRESYEALEEEYRLIREMLAARSKFGVVAIWGQVYTLDTIPLFPYNDHHKPWRDH